MVKENNKVFQLRIFYYQRMRYQTQANEHKKLLIKAENTKKCADLLKALYTSFKMRNFKVEKWRRSPVVSKFENNFLSMMMMELMDAARMDRRIKFIDFRHSRVLVK